ncbi:hypothetical protein [Sporosarcina sp. FSL K6-3508]|uniref:hypothetical protein n=1 Tax=Sporosarcina sp. FSL K6-3508 TaxID=2921557 RepID=UPI00315A6C9B
MKKEIEHTLPQVEQKPIEDFCIDDRCCPERFPSPTNCLPFESFEQMEKEIKAANELLLDLALEDRPPEEIFRKVFAGLEGLKVIVIMNEGKTITGKVMTVGFDFVVLLDGKVEIILPYRQIDMVKPCGRFAEPTTEPSLLNIDSCLRRDIAFCFGEIVASSPELLQRFFKIRLTIYLLLLDAKIIEITLDNTVIEGLVMDVDKETIVIESNKKLKVIPIDKITLIKKYQA